MAERQKTGTMIVTGGSRGIGAAVIAGAARAGYRICFSYGADQAGAERVVADAEGAGARITAVKADMGTEEGVMDLFSACDAAYGAPDVLINNAGITGKMTRVADMEASEITRVMNINVMGYFLAAREAIRRMSTQRGGRGGSIVNVSSRAAVLGGPGEFVHYGASKGATDTMTLGMSKELGAEGIRVNAVRPGLIETDIHALAGAPDRVERLMSGVPMGRAGSAEEVARTILWLAGPDSSYVSGALLDVSGGR
ncbi:SDR family oxidoreductase [Saliniramus sp.]|uniref:SDR family oxidoreductase n=1 Tax=Saliniramus sp. TaxID=2986772 RepID=UPI002B710AC9|nr:SDR family oxidoreductase [Saliniramus sp.]HMB10382.1 SDR family oxidoreductase [Saliniramus sp.]